MKKQDLAIKSPVAARVSGRSSFIFMTIVDDENGINLFCQERIAQYISQ